MLRRDLLALLTGAAVMLAIPNVARASDDTDDSDSRGRGRGRGRGGDNDNGLDDRGGGSSSGHGSAEERAAVFGDDRGDRSSARLRENLKEDEIHEHEMMQRGGVMEHSPGADNARSRGFLADLAELFGMRER